MGRIRHQSRQARKPSTPGQLLRVLRFQTRTRKGLDKRQARAFVGRWKIVEMDEWDQHYVDEEMPGHIEFESRGIGHFHFGYVDAQTNWQYDESLGRVDFTFEGNAEMDPTSGRGWAKVEGKQMSGQIVFHGGDQSGFKASKRK